MMATLRRSDRFVMFQPAPDPKARGNLLTPLAESPKGSRPACRWTLSEGW